jgi:hypothetical protein
MSVLRNHLPKAVSGTQSRAIESIDAMIVDAGFAAEGAWALDQPEVLP